ncbi:unnamed protein product, partial [Leptidea sinapis]
VGSASCMSTISIGGRGKIAALMSKMKEPKPGSGPKHITALRHRAAEIGSLRCNVVAWRKRAFYYRMVE